MENENNINNFKRPRKLLKIKRSRPLETPHASFGMPTKVNNLKDENNGYGDISPNESYYADNGDMENIHFITDEELIPTNSDSIKDYLQNKTVLLMLMIAMMIGAILSYTFIPSQQGKVKSGLEGVVPNSNVPSGVSRCGTVLPHRACVIYIMNPKNKEQEGKDFYKAAATWTNREPYLINTSNMNYSSTRIKPGAIAQIYVPAMSY